MDKLMLCVTLYQKSGIFRYILSEIHTSKLLTSVKYIDNIICQKYVQIWVRM
jgi:hypothetical protein